MQSSFQRSPQVSHRATPTPARNNEAMNSTGNSFWRQSISIDHSPAKGPSRISASKKIPSACMPGGLALNSPSNDPTANAFSRENNRLAGFGPGMASALIGNAGRRGNSMTVNDVKDNRTAMGSIGWGIEKSHLDTGIWRRLLPEMPHKKMYDFGGLKDLPHMDTTGAFAAHLDHKLGLPYEALEELSVREQRVIIKRRLAE